MAGERSQKGGVAFVQILAPFPIIIAGVLTIVALQAVECAGARYYPRWAVFI